MESQLRYRRCQKRLSSEKLRLHPERSGLKQVASRCSIDRYEREADRNNRRRIAGSGNHCIRRSETPPLYNVVLARIRTQNGGSG